MNKVSNAFFAASILGVTSFGAVGVYASDELKVSVNDDGTPGFITGNLGTLDNASTGARSLDSNSDRAMAKFLKSFVKQHYDPAGNETFKLRKAKRDDLGTVHGRFDQRINRLPVFGAQLIVHARIDNGGVYAVNGDFVNGAGAAKRARIAPTQGLAAALRAMDVADFTVIANARLGYLPQGERRNPRLVWRTRVEHESREGPKDAFVDIDAITGAFVGYVSNTPSAGIRVRDARFKKDRSGLLACKENEACPDDVTQSAHDNTQIVLDYFDQVHARDSYDDEGAKAFAIVNYRSDENRPYQGAFWSRNRMIFGEGDGLDTHSFSKSLDVVAHEFTHGVIRADSDLVYKNESGALNEAWADILGVSTVIWNRGDFDDLTFHIGRDLYINPDDTTATRFMDNPTENGRSKDFYPERYTGFGDAGGVHHNSGIADLAYVLLVKGGQHPRGKTDYNVQGIGVSAAEKIFYRAQSTYLSPDSDFVDARNATAQAAQDLYGVAIANRVHEAWCAVGVPKCPFGVDPKVPDSLQVIRAGTTYRGLSGGNRHMIWFAIDVPAGLAKLKIVTKQGTGDVDMLVRRSNLPDQERKACSSARDGTTENCTIVKPRAGRWYISLAGWGSFEDVRLRVQEIL